MPDDLQRLLKYIVYHYIGREDVKDIELDASAAELTRDMQATQRQVLREEEQRAETLAPAFRLGLERAAASRRAGGNAISLDDRKPDEDRIADALIYFLVGPGLATSSTRETEPLHYIYTISVDWPRLATVARDAGVDLDALLAQTS
ncbi:MAG: hypothetical protein IRY97_02225 [Thermomicrobiaceae bacterium]|nr:hypothetical protein [Thermomicrobiaceae bacterium]